MMIDSLGRSVDYLRLSITRTCMMQCSYCRPAAPGRDGRPVLTLAEIVALVRHLVVRHGVTKVRLTGGEPTTRRDLPRLVQCLSAIKGLHSLVMTTNGLSLAEQATRLAGAGLQRVNVSLDSLCPRTFARITGVDGLERVLRGVDAAVAAGLTPVKLNAVVVRGENDRELPALIEFAARRMLEIRLIELMPMGPLSDRWAERFVPEDAMRRRLAERVVSWEALPGGVDSARRFSVRLDDGRQATVGFIAAMSRPFCGRCNRLRIAADGAVYPCLMGAAAETLLPALRPVFNPSAVDQLLESHLTRKAVQHPVAGAAVMSHLGG
jgi:cyclic pyranopterin phosphate synthase